MVHLQSGVKKDGLRKRPLARQHIPLLPDTLQPIPWLPRAIPSPKELRIPVYITGTSCHSLGSPNAAPHFFTHAPLFRAGTSGPLRGHGCFPRISLL